MSNGLRYDDIWNLTMKELNDVVREIHNKEKNNYLLSCNLVYVNALATAEGFGGKIRPFSEYFPEANTLNGISEDDKLKMRLLNMANKKK